MGFLIQGAHMLEMGVVDVGIHAEQALEYGADHTLKCWREGLPIVLREDAGIIHLRQAGQGINSWRMHVNKNTNIKSVH